MSNSVFFSRDTIGIFEVGHRLEDGTLAALGGNYTCRAVIFGTGLDQTVTTLNGAGNRFVVWFDPPGTGEVGLTPGYYSVAVQIENMALTPPLRAEVHFPIQIRKDAVPDNN